MSITAKIERELLKNPTLRNRDLVDRYGCSNGLVSKIRSRLGLPYFHHQAKTFRVHLPAYLLKPLAAIAAETGPDVSLDDLVCSVLDDVAAEYWGRLPGRGDADPPDRADAAAAN